MAARKSAVLPVALGLLGLLTIASVAMASPKKKKVLGDVLIDDISIEGPEGMFPVSFTGSASEKSNWEKRYKSVLEDGVITTLFAESLEFRRRGLHSLADNLYNFASDKQEEMNNRYLAALDEADHDTVMDILDEAVLAGAENILGQWAFDKHDVFPSMYGAEYPDEILGNA